MTTLSVPECPWAASGSQSTRSGSASSLVVRVTVHHQRVETGRSSVTHTRAHHEGSSATCAA